LELGVECIFVETASKMQSLLLKVHCLLAVSQHSTITATLFTVFTATCWSSNMYLHPC